MRKLAGTLLLLLLIGGLVSAQDVADCSPEEVSLALIRFIVFAEQLTPEITAEDLLTGVENEVSRLRRQCDGEITNSLAYSSETDESPLSTDLDEGTWQMIYTGQGDPPIITWFSDNCPDFIEFMQAITRTNDGFSAEFETTGFCSSHIAISDEATTWTLTFEKVE